MSDKLILVVEVTPGVEGRNNVYLVDYAKSTIKDWIVKTTVWAVINGHSVTVRAATDHDLETRWLFRPRSRQPEEQSA